MSFAAVKKWFEGLSDQMMGDACAVCQTGEPYVEFAIVNLARPGDEEVIETRTAETFQRLINQYFEDRAGTIYWRVPFEWDISDHYQVVKYDPNGPDVDFLTNQRCHVDRNWKRVACYARLYKARQRTRAAA